MATIDTGNSTIDIQSRDEGVEINVWSVDDTGQVSHISYNLDEEEAAEFRDQLKKQQRESEDGSVTIVFEEGGADDA